MFGRASGMVRIGFGTGPCDLNLSPKADLNEAVANLFHLLRAADALAVPSTTACAAPQPLVYAAGRPVASRADLCAV